MTVASEMKTALATYLDGVASTLSDLARLEELANVHSTVIETNREINLEITESQRQISHLYGQREELFNDFHNATFEGESERIEEIQHQKNEIDRRISELEDGIETAREKIVDVDSFAIAEMLSQVDNAEVPSFFGARIEPSRWRMSNGGYASTPPTGLLAELQAGNDKLVAEINAVKSRIRGMQQWYRFTPKPPLTPAEKKLREALATR